jgi:hypothetical protein
MKIKLFKIISSFLLISIIFFPSTNIANAKCTQPFSVFHASLIVEESFLYDDVYYIDEATFTYDGNALYQESLLYNETQLNLDNLNTGIVEPECSSGGTSGGGGRVGGGSSGVIAYSPFTYSFGNTKVYIGSHTVNQAISRNISKTTLQNTVRIGKGYKDISTGARVKYDPNTDIGVVIDKTKNQTITIYRVDRPKPEWTFNGWDW